MEKKNQIASVIRGIAIAIGVIGLLLAITVAMSANPLSYNDTYGTPGFLVVFLACGFIAVLLYGFAEIIDLLQGIKDNTAITGNIIEPEDIDQLPEL